MAAMAGMAYLIVNKENNRTDKLIVFSLCFIFIIDLSAITYGLYGYVYDYKYVEFLKDTPFKGIYWIYNILILITNSLYAVYFLWQLRSRVWKKLIWGLIGGYILSSIIYYAISDVFFDTTSAFTYISGAFLTCIAIAGYYLELLSTNRILNFRNELALYISVGLLIYQLAFTPLFFFQRYIRVDNEFGDVYGLILDTSNLFMYSVFTIGFIRKIVELKKIRQIASG
ncbi:hypothetical protein LPB144_01690 [Christiangramia salexigens]|uniref:Rhodopsin n=2 Tax=Christiangramia salexigens TaxID=1913577 RepID=A0A1L3J251_9FLAO|nr:hypothetical protein LPB144_01690 [Christiangramia salexigens]